MRNVVLEIDGERHKLVQIKPNEVFCGQCSLSKYCLEQKNDTMYCEQLSPLYGGDINKYNLHFKLEDGTDA